MNLRTYAATLYHWWAHAQTTYSQNGEDVIARFFLSHIKKGWYLDIGANDPKFMNNTYLFYKQGWRGCCVEPNAFRASLIRAFRPGDAVLKAGVGAKTGQTELYVFDPDTLSTFSEPESKELESLGHTLLKKQTVDIVTLKDIFAKHMPVTGADLMSLDTEGQDMEILRSNDWNLYRPKIVIVETTKYLGDHASKQGREFDEFFASVKYGKLADTYINTLYIEESYAAKEKIDIGR